MTEAPELAAGPDDAPEGESVRGRWARRLVACSLALGLIAGGVGTAAFTIHGADDAVAAQPAGPGPRAMTDNEAYRFSVARYQNFRTRGVHVRAAIPSGTSRVLIVGDVDYRRGLGYARVTGAGAASGIYQWTAARVLTWGAKGPSAQRPATVPDRKPVQRQLDRRLPIDAVLLILLQQATSRPENVARLQAGSTFMRATSVKDRAVDVIRGARRPDGRVLDYWVDADGRIKRVTTRLTAAPAITLIDMDARAFKTFPRAAELAPVKKVPVEKAPVKKG